MQFLFRVPGPGVWVFYAESVPSSKLYNFNRISDDHTQLGHLLTKVISRYVPGTGLSKTKIAL